MVATAQLKRVSGKGQPTLEDLRESGQIEQDADVVMFLWNRDRDAKIGQQDPIEKYLGVAKQRNGPVGSVNLTFGPQYTAFEEEATLGEN
jgi:replicative DNA helicase